MIKHLFKFNRVILIFFIIAILISSVLITYKAKEATGKEILNAYDVIRTFKMEGISFKPATLLYSKDYMIEDTEPTIYTDSRGNYLFIYTFNSFVEREAKFKDEYGLIQKFAFTLKEKTYYPRLFRVKNLQLVYAIPYPNEESDQAIYDYLKKINRVIFTGLNAGKEIVFTGESPSWTAKVSIKYYEHFWTDSENKVRYERYHTKAPTITYKGQIPEKPVPLEYSFSTIASHMGGTRDEITPKELTKVITLGSGGGNGLIPSNQAYQVKITLDGKTEEFEAKLGNTANLVNFFY